MNFGSTQYRERRRFLRLALGRPVQVERNGTWVETTLINISQSGAMLETLSGAEVGERLRCRLELHPDRAPFEADAIIRSISGNETGLQFVRGRRKIAVEVRQIINKVVVPELERRLGADLSDTEAIIELGSWYRETGKIAEAVRLYRHAVGTGSANLKLYETVAGWLLDAAGSADDVRVIVSQLKEVLANSREAGNSDFLDYVRTEVLRMSSARGMKTDRRVPTAHPRRPVKKTDLRDILDRGSSPAEGPRAVSPLRAKFLKLPMALRWLTIGGAAAVILMSLLLLEDIDDPTAQPSAGETSATEDTPQTPPRAASETSPVSATESAATAVGAVEPEIWEPPLISSAEAELIEGWQPNLIARPINRTAQRTNRARRPLPTPSNPIPEEETPSSDSEPSILEPTADPAATATPETAPDELADEHMENAAGHLRKNKPLLAIEQLEKAIRLSPERAEIYLAIGLANALLGRQTRARAAYQQFIDMAPNHPKAAKIREILSAEP